MKRVAFFINPNLSWMGGVNYYKNLFLALSLLKEKQFKYFIFLPKSAKVFNFEKYCDENIIYDDTFLSSFGSTLKSYIEKYNIDILSHMGIVSDIFDAKVVNWIPDFQHKHLKQYFKKDELQKRDEKFELYAKYADVVILSSYDAQNDFKTFLPTYKDKSKVLQFVSSVDFDELNQKNIKVKKEDNFFFLPNQFWQHKNHMTVFKALKELKKQGIEIVVLCSGHLDDYRNQDYIKEIKEFIFNNKLENNIKLLGIISHKELYTLMLRSLYVINPSSFEGWSTTVEECKTLQKPMILSDIRVHKEQNPKNSIFFNPNDHIELSCILRTIWEKNITSFEPDIEQLREVMRDNLICFGYQYEKILSEL